MATPAEPNSSAPILTPHNITLALLIASPLLLAVPPRKLDLYTFSLCTTFVYSANFQTTSRTGKTILQHFGARLPSQQKQGKKSQFVRNRTEQGTSGGIRGVVNNIWMGNETEGWEERRAQEEREVLEEGRGYSGLITDRIWEVWHREKKNTAERKGNIADAKTREGNQRDQ